VIAADDPERECQMLVAERGGRVDALVTTASAV
jgi:hypothetical protein